MKKGNPHIALIGGGPSALFIYKRLVESGRGYNVTIFEKGQRLGAGMPYSANGSNPEHVTNVSANEIPELLAPPGQWLSDGIKNVRDNTSFFDKPFSPYRVFPRLVFGDYLEDQFYSLLAQGEAQGINNRIKLNTSVADIQHLTSHINVITSDGKEHAFDKVILCTGHQFPTGLDEHSTGVYRSPYPPNKLSRVFNHPVALKGASLTAVDAIKTLARANGTFAEKHDGSFEYTRSPDSPEFKIVLHCRSGMLPAVRFHLEDTRLKNPSLLSPTQIDRHRKNNDGYLSLDYIFEKDFKEPLASSDPDFYRIIKDLTMEQFVAEMLKMRQGHNPFEVMRRECAEARVSIERRQSVHWKEMLGVLSFALNYPAKYFSAEDMLRYKATLQPLIGLVIAYIPQSSCRELLALHEAGCLEMISVGWESEIVPYGTNGITYHYFNDAGTEVTTWYQTFVDCTGQPHVEFNDFPFQSLVREGSLRQATLMFRDAEEGKRYQTLHPNMTETGRDGMIYLRVPGIAINDNFQVIGTDGIANSDIYMMAVPCMGGYNPDYSGLDFAEEASKRIIESMTGIHQSRKDKIENTLEVA